MTPAVRSLAAVAVFTFISAPAFADCDVVNFPETHISADADADQLRAMATTLNEMNGQLNDYSTCIDKMEADAPPSSATDEEKAAFQAKVDMHVKAHDESLDNLQKAAAEFNAAVKKYNSTHKPSKG